MDTSIFFRVTASLGEGYQLELIISYSPLVQSPPSSPSLRH